MDDCRNEATEVLQKTEAYLADRIKGPERGREGGMPPHHKAPALSGPATDCSNFQATPEDRCPREADALA